MEETPLHGPDYEVLGLSLFGPPPVGVVHLRWEPSLLVLYGKNGSGKTAILEGIQAVLAGESQSSRMKLVRMRELRTNAAFLHIRLTEEATPIRWDWEYFTTDLIGAIADHTQKTMLDPGSQAFASSSLDSAWADFENVLASDNPLDTVRAGLTLQLGQANKHLVDEVAKQQVFSLKAERRGWQVFASAVLSGETPQTNGWLKPFQERIAGDGPQQLGDAEAMILRFLEGDRPGWLPIPIARIGQLQSEFTPAVFAPSSGESPDRLTQDFLEQHLSLDEFYRQLWAHVFTEESDQRPDTEFARLLKELSVQATANLAGLLKDAPVLVLEVEEMMFWPRDEYVSWSAWDTPTSTLVPLSALSEAQQRWASVAIQWALWNQEPHGYHKAMLIDEPEQALHSQAIQHLLRDLQETPGSTRGPVFVATHSPQFLTAPKATLLHVRRGGDGLAEAVPMDSELRSGFHDASQRLGLKVADVLQLVRVFLLVEGRHDMAVFEETIGDELQAAQVHMLPIYGTKNASGIIESELLLDFTDADIMLALDNLRVRTVTSAWLKAQEAASRNDLRSAKRRLTRILEKPDVTKEEKTALRFCLKAIDIGQAERMQIWGLKKPDILNYLPVKGFFPDAETWEAPTAAWRRERTHREDMKSWMRRTIQDPQRRPIIPNLRRAARQLQKIPPEFTYLLEACRALAGRG